MRLAGILLFMISTTVYASRTMECTHYVYSEVPFVTISMKVKADGGIERLAEVTHYGNTQQVAVEENDPGEGELYNLTVDADRPGQELFLKVFLSNEVKDRASYAAKLINPQSPAMKEMAGQCILNE